MTGGGTSGYFLLSSVRVPFHLEIRGADEACSFQLCSRRCRLQVPTVREAVDIECSFQNELIRTLSYKVDPLCIYVDVSSE